MAIFILIVLVAWIATRPISLARIGRGTLVGCAVIVSLFVLVGCASEPTYRVPCQGTALECEILQRLTELEDAESRAKLRRLCAGPPGACPW